MLTPNQIDSFNRDGFVIARILDPADLLPMQAEITAWLDQRAQALHREGLLRDLHQEAPFATRFGLLAAQCDEIHAGYDTTDILGDAMFQYMRHPRLLDAIACLVGPEITLNPIQHLRAKPPVGLSSAKQGYYEVPWHQDAGVTTEDADAHLIITAWTPLLGATEAMGCMRLHPGFPRRCVAHINDPRYGTTIRPDLLPATPPVPAVCQPGEVVLMHQFTPHMSTANQSGICRWSLDLRYQATGTPSGRAWYPSTIVRSADPTREVRDASVWRQAWRTALARPNPGARHRVAAAR